MAISIVVFERDPKLAQSLAGGLQPHFHSIHLTHSADELWHHVARNRPQAVIMNLEAWRIADVASLHREFPALPIVCTHRIPDEEIWMAALDAGASDVCAADDVQNVLTSVLRNTALQHSAAA